MTSEQYVVCCSEAAWESHPMSHAEAMELLHSPEPAHPFAGACRDRHHINRTPKRENP